MSGQKGYCGETAVIRAARAALHMWEEPCLSGTGGSGTVFFSGCVLRCVYCQNSTIACGSCGREITDDRLADIFIGLQQQGAHNINLVTPTHFVPGIRSALEKALNRGLSIPVVYNTGSYENTDTLRMLEGLVDIYLPDLKYYSRELSKKYSGAENYFEVASSAIAEMVRQVGSPDFDADGIMKKGVIVRHLVLPGQGEDSRRILKYLHDTYGNDIYISIMNQYTPVEAVKEQFPELACRVGKKEYDGITDYAIDAGIEYGFIQEGDTAEESFIPEFDMKGI